MKLTKLLVWFIALCMALTLTPMTSFANEPATDPQDVEMITEENAEPTEQAEEVEEGTPPD